jgi:hypothetical protein
MAAVAAASNISDGVFDLNSQVVRRQRRRMRFGGGPNNLSTKNVEGVPTTVIPSDQAFIDVMLEGRKFDDPSKSLLFDVEGFRNSSTNNNVLAITFTHEIFYCGEAIFSIKTTTQCNGSEIWGQSSSCVLGNGQVKIKIRNKGKPADGDGRNSRETEIYTLEELVKLSAKARQEELEFQASNN